MNNLGFIHRFLSLWPWLVMAIISGIALYEFLTVAFRLSHWKRLLRRQTTCLEITPPITTMKTARANQELMNIFHGLSNNRPFKDKLLKRQTVLSLQMLSTRE